MVRLLCLTYNLQALERGAPRGLLPTLVGGYWSDARSGFCARNVGHDYQMKKKKLRFSAKKAASAKPQRAGYDSLAVLGVLRARL